MGRRTLLGWALVTVLLPHPGPERSEGEGPARPAFEDRGEGPSVASLPRDEVSAGARSPDWSRLALEIHAETNLVRRNPAAYARHLEAMLPRFEGKLLERPGRPTLRTDEGAAAVREAIAALRARKPMQELHWSRGLAGAAVDHVRDQGPIGGLEHRGTDGSDPARRAARRGRWLTAMAENIAYGDNPARQVVIQLLVDDGVRDRGHRDNILDPRWGAEGVACGPHREYRQICVMDYAVRYVERR